MPIIIILIILTGIFAYTLYELHFSLKHRGLVRIKTLDENLKLIKKDLITSDGIKISSWYIPVKNPKAVVILVHGYKEVNADKIRMLYHAEYLNKAGYSTILIDLRSFGESDGNKVTLGVKEWRDVEAAYDYAKNLPENKNKKIGFLGKSMGGVTSIIVKGIAGKGDFIIALTPYASFNSLFSFQLKQKGYYLPLFLPFLKLAAFFELGFNYEKYDVLKLIKKINVPLFVTSAKRDEIIPPADAKEIYERANNPKEFWESDTTHTTFANDPTELKKRVLNFLSKYIELS